MQIYNIISISVLYLGLINLYRLGFTMQPGTLALTRLRLPSSGNQLVSSLSKNLFDAKRWNLEVLG